MTNEEHPIEYLPELALGVLPEAEAMPVRVHLARCESCRDEFDEMVLVAALLPLAAEDAEPSPTVKEGVLARVGREPRPIPIARRARPVRWLPIAAAVAALAVIAGAVSAGYLAGARSGDDPGEDAVYAEAAARGTLQTVAGSAGNARAVVVRAPGRSEAFAWVEGLPALAAGKAYQAWFIDAGGAEPAEVFATPEGGVWLSAKRSIDDYTAIGLTIEDKGGAKTPSAAPFVTVELNKRAGRP